MPTYEYACKSCGETVEVAQAFTDAPLTECRSCGGPLRKVFGNVGISFKGSGFYKTDSRGGAKKKEVADASAGGDGSGSAKSDGGSSDPSGEKSPATTKESKPDTPSGPAPKSTSSPSTTPSKKKPAKQPSR